MADEDQSRRPRQPADGFTIVELLVVIAIIAILIALLFPAVQAAREAARRTVCGNKMRQVALAAIARVDQIGEFPTGSKVVQFGTDAFCPDRNGSMATTWQWRLREPYTVQILPFMEQMPLYDSFDLSLDFPVDNWDRGAPDYTTNPTNYQLASTPNPAFLCPSSPLQLGPYNNYMGSAGGGPPDFSTDPAAACTATLNPRMICVTNGMMFANSAIRPAHVRDGLSNTYLFGESKYMMPREARHPSDPGWGQKKHGLWAGGIWSLQRYRHYTNLVGAVDEINFAPIDMATGSWDTSVIGRTFGSWHAAIARLWGEQRRDLQPVRADQRFGHDRQALRAGPGEARIRSRAAAFGLSVTHRRIPEVGAEPTLTV